MSTRTLQVLPFAMGCNINNTRQVLALRGVHCLGFTSKAQIIPPSQDEQLHNFLATLKLNLGLKQLEDWYTVQPEHFEQYGGTEYLQVYKGSVSALITDTFKNHDWKLWLFERVPSNWFRNDENIKKYIKSLHTKMNLSDLNDWYKVSLGQMLAFSTTRYAQTSGLYGAVALTYPGHKWESERLALEGSRLESVQYLKDKLSELLSTPLQESPISKFGPDIVELSIASLKIAIGYSNGNRVLEQQRWYKELGYTFVPVPFWWDMQISSLGATILQHAPKLKIDEHSKTALPIPNHPPAPTETTLGNEKVFMLGQDWDFRDDPKGWWMSEKFDGIRAYWDGKQFWSRQLKVMSVPHFYKIPLPNIPMDGELWLHRGEFKKVMGLVISRKKTQERVDCQEEWKNVKFMVFDVPTVEGIYEARMELMKELKVCLPDYVIVVDAEKCNNATHMMDRYLAIVNAGGEGVMLRKPGSPYYVGRTNSLRKVKQYVESEARLVAVRKGTLICETSDGVEFAVRCTPKLIVSPPPIGSVITVKHMERYSTGTLRAAHFYRERPDVTWDQILRQKEKSKAML